MGTAHMLGEIDTTVILRSTATTPNSRQIATLHKVFPTFPNLSAFLETATFDAFRGLPFADLNPRVPCDLESVTWHGIHSEATLAARSFD